MRRTLLPTRANRRQSHATVELTGALLLGSLFGVGCGNDTATTRPNVLLLSIDSLRRDHVGAYGYTNRFHPAEQITPALDALAADGVLFEQAYSSTSWTLPSHAALMTGLPDALHGVVNNEARIASDMTTLAELLGGAGYRTGGFFSGPNVHPAFGFGDGFEIYSDLSQVDVPGEFFEREDGDGSFLDVHHASHQSVTSPGLLDAATQWIEDCAAGDAPWFTFVHWWDVHYDYSAPEEYVQRFASPDFSGNVRGVYRDERAKQNWSVAERDDLLALYAAEVRFTDDHIGRLLTRLDELGLTDDTLVVVVSDHGEEFFEHGRWGHQHTLYEEVVRIPLILRWPAGLAARTQRIGGPVRLFDVYATVAAAAGVAVPDYVEGSDLLEAARAGASRIRAAPLHLDVPQIRANQSALVDGRYKVLHDRRRKSVTGFDLGTDSGEQAPIATPRSVPKLEPLATELDAELARWAATRPDIPGANSGERPAVSDALNEALRNAGYVGEEE